MLIYTYIHTKKKENAICVLSSVPAMTYSPRWLPTKYHQHCRAALKTFHECYIYDGKFLFV